MEDRISALEARVRELEETDRLMSGAIKLIRERLDELEKKPAPRVKPESDLPPSGARTFGPPKSRAKQKLQPVYEDGEHVIPDEMWAKKVDQDERKKAGLWAGRNQAIVTLCDEPKCVAGHHRKVMSRADAAAFNSQRSAIELAGLDKRTVRFVIENLVTEVSGGHWIYSEGSYSLPSGRSISVNRAVQWAFNDHVGEVPRFIRTNCGRKDCSAPAHLKVDR